MQILLFNEIVASVLFNIIAGLYTLVARIYDILLELVRNDGNAFASLNFNFTQTIYVLAGVFMLFRVTIGMLQMIINPDTVSDKEAGAGKMIKRIVTCIILLIALSPDFIIFNKKDGLLIEVEQAILADDGLINRLMPVSSIKEKHSDNMSSKSKLLVDDVYAANEKLTCYYINVKSHKKNLVGTNWTHSYVINDVYKIEFYNNPDTGPTGKLNCGDGTCKFSYYDRSDQRIHGDSDNGYYSPFPGKITMGTVFNVTSSNFPTTCPKYLKKTSDSTYSAQKSMPKGEIDGCDSEVVTASGPQTCKNIGIMGGYNNYNDFEKAIKGLKMNASGQQASHSVETNNLFIGKNTSTSAFTYK